MKKLKQTLLGICAVGIVSFIPALYVGLIGLLVYTAIHFIRKYW